MHYKRKEGVNMVEVLSDTEIDDLVNMKNTITFEQPIIGTYKNNNDNGRTWVFKINQIKVRSCEGRNSDLMEISFEFNPGKKDKLDERSFLLLRFDSEVLQNNDKGQMIVKSYAKNPTKLSNFLHHKLLTMSKSVLNIIHYGTDFLIGEQPDEDSAKMQIWIQCTAMYTSGVVTDSGDNKVNAHIPTRSNSPKKVELKTKKSNLINDTVQLKAYQDCLIEAIDKATKEWNNDLNQYQLQLRTKILDLLKI